MNWLKSLGRPQLTRPRKVPKSGGSGDEKTHPCTNGDAKGRCYETSSGQYAFVPLGGDENTFDYGLNQGMTKLISWKLGSDQATIVRSPRLPGPHMSTPSLLPLILIQDRAVQHRQTRVILQVELVGVRITVSH